MVNLYITLDDKYVQWVNFATLFVMILTSVCSVFHIDRSSEVNLVPVCVCMRACVVDGIENCVSTFIILVFKHAILSYMDIAQINTES